MVDYTWFKYVNRVTVYSYNYFVIFLVFMTHYEYSFFCVVQLMQFILSVLLYLFFNKIQIMIHHKWFLTNLVYFWFYQTEVDYQNERTAPNLIIFWTMLLLVNVCIQILYQLKEIYLSISVGLVEPLI